MHDYDTAMKRLLLGSSGLLLRRITGGGVAEWLNVELPRVRNPRVDLVARRPDGTHVHVELQSYNDPELGLREAEYYVALLRRFREHVDQVVLYVGAGKMRMEQPFKTKSMTLSYELVDASLMDGDSLLASADLGDNMAAILTTTGKERVIRRVLHRLTELRGEALESATMQFVILCGLRGLEEETIETARRHMPLVVDLAENKVLGKAYREGREEGREEGARNLAQAAVEERFGTLPGWALARLAKGTQTELLAWIRNAPSAASLEELLRG